MIVEAGPSHQMVRHTSGGRSGMFMFHHFVGLLLALAATLAKRVAVNADVVVGGAVQVGGFTREGRNMGTSTTARVAFLVAVADIAVIQTRNVSVGFPDVSGVRSFLFKMTRA